MKYLLDVNVVMALLLDRHEHHAAARAWVASQPAGAELLLATWVQVGFMRVAVQSRLAPDVATARGLLDGMLDGKTRTTLVADDSPYTAIPTWADTPAKLADGHLLALAKRHHARLATFDTSIPDAHTLA